MNVWLLERQCNRTTPHWPHEWPEWRRYHCMGVPLGKPQTPETGRGYTDPRTRPENPAAASTAPSKGHPSPSGDTA